jgi:NADH-quinone oxidoreductase subunit J
MPAIPDLILFLILAVIAVASALGMLFGKNAVYSALNLIVNFGTVAVFYLLMGAPFIALAQVTVYAGAIMVLFLFVIMLMGAIQLRKKNTLPTQQPLAFVLGGILLLEALYLVITRSGKFPAAGAVAAGFGDPRVIGETLFSQYVLPFEITSVLLLVAMVGAIVLTRRRKKI